MTPHSGTFVVHEERRVHSGELVKDEYSALRGGKISLDGEGRWARPRSKSCEVDPVVRRGEGD